MAPREHVAHLVALQDNIRESVLPFLEKELGIRVANDHVQVALSVLSAALELFIEDGTFLHASNASLAELFRNCDAHPLAISQPRWSGTHKYAFVLGPGLVRDEFASLVDAALRYWRRN